MRVVRNDMPLIPKGEPLLVSSTGALDGSSDVRPRACADLRAGPAREVRGWHRSLFAALGGLFVCLGAVGVVIPGIPTTPFVLVASYFLLRSSPSLHRRLLESRAFGPLLRDWQEHRGLRRGVKRKALACCGVMVGLSIAFGGLSWPGRVLVAAAGAYGIWFVARLPVVPRADSP